MGYTVGGAFLCIAVFFGVYVWVAIRGVVDRIKRPSCQPAASASSRPEPSGKTACKYHAHALDGGIIGMFATVLDAPPNAAKYPSVKVAHVFSKFDRKTLEFMAAAVRDGKLVIPISQKLPLSEAAEAQATAEKGGTGKILLVA